MSLDRLRIMSTLRCDAEENRDPSLYCDLWYGITFGPMEDTLQTD